LTHLAPAPAKKPKRKGGDEDKERGAFIRRNLRRLWRKMTWKTCEDGRDPRPAVDSQWWHLHRQRTAAIAPEQGRELRPGRPDYPSPTP
jgi:hypothetical protein